MDPRHGRSALTCAMSPPAPSRSAGPTRISVRPGRRRRAGRIVSSTASASSWSCSPPARCNAGSRPGVVGQRRAREAALAGGQPGDVDHALGARLRPDLPLRHRDLRRLRPLCAAQRHALRCAGAAGARHCRGHVPRRRAEQPVPRPATDIQPRGACSHADRSPSPSRDRCHSHALRLLPSHPRPHRHARRTFSGWRAKASGSACTPR